MMEGPQMQQGHDYLRAPPVPAATAASAAPAEFGRPNVIFDGKRMRKPVHRRTVDYSSTVVRYIQNRTWQRDCRDAPALQPTSAAVVDMLPTVAYPDNPATSFTTKFVHPSTNKVRCSINRVLWTPNGRRLITGSQSGEFTLWNGQSFNFEMILQAHDLAVRSMVWSHNENWMVTGDDGGCIKYWQTNMNNVKANKTAHKEAVRDLSFSSTDLKFCSCSDDTTVKVWDFARCQEERSLTGHGWDVKSVDWHPQKALLVSGAKDNLVKLWDAKTGRVLCTLHGHKNTVLSVKWNSNGNWVLTASRDQTIKLYDIRTLKELESYRGHRKEVTSLAWHPFHEDLFVSGSYDGSIIHWLVGHEGPQAEVANAHESSVWDLAWHPMGHILCSGSNDHTTKFWCRNRPGETLRENRQSNAHAQGASANDSHLQSQNSGSNIGNGPSRSEGAIPGVGMALEPVVAGRLPLPPAPNQNPSLRGPHPPSTPYPNMFQQPQQQQQHQFHQHNQQQPQQRPQSLPPPPQSRPPQNQAQLQPQPQSQPQPLLNRPVQQSMMIPNQHMQNQMNSQGPTAQGPPQQLRPPMGPSPPLGPPPSMRSDYMQGGPQGYMARSPGIGVVPGPYMTMPGQLVPGPPPLPYQGGAPPNMMDIRAHGMNVSMGMNVGMGMTMNMGVPHSHPSGPPPGHG
ncbi:flowering time control protein FY isoform X2 [Physcomitrium patens]|uniref:Uncharacterized protein n=1 Tax=Physcomitrium patens TaxID=3218 RepID=A0A2K1J8W3_PHYPA|nr:flowering time control protein FY-like [Physcomitrium patens]PNR37963.1 hypothetical protein PHYPA_021073 [Physcomitrium patens]|eukprot:XP_024399411.1 flowering time control protein FY-like [Physcomitrella patens]